MAGAKPYKWCRFSSDRPKKLRISLTIAFGVVIWAFHLRSSLLLVGNDTIDAKRDIALFDILSRDGFFNVTADSSMVSRKIEKFSQKSQLAVEEKRERKIAFVHVGKAGGMTLRSATALECILQRFPVDRVNHVEECIKQRFRTNNKLSLQTNVYFHVWKYNETELQEATSYLFSLRNPVDRIISTYRYSHPKNCIKTTPLTALSRGCSNAKYMDKPNSNAYRVFFQCFPSPGIEKFAQATMNPWIYNSTNKFAGVNSTEENEWECRKVARALVQGKILRGPLSGVGKTAPHMVYNYEYYANKTIWQHPGKEVFVIRTEQQWTDILNLDRRLGGNGLFLNKNTFFSHGSEHYKPSPVSKQAYKKLCCALGKEIEIYLDILHAAENLSPEEKDTTSASLFEKCGLTESSFDQWRGQCRTKLEEDRHKFPSYID